MNKKNVEGRISDSFNSATPQIYSRIEQDVANMSVDRTRARKPSGGSIFWKLATAVLSLVLVVMSVIGIVSNVTQTAQASTVSLDVNPSVEIVLNRNNRVVKVNALNTDGETIISGMDFNGCQLEVAVNALIGSMLRAGYLSDMANSVLVSVNSDKKNYQTIAELVANEITVTLRQGQIEASVVSQWIQSDDEIAAIARQYGISLGKAQLIAKITSKTDYTVEQLAELTVNELSLLLPNIGIDEDVEQTGSASDKQYIDKDTALSLALNAASLENVTTENGLRVLVQKLDFDDGVMVYKVEFVYNNYEYAVEIGALSKNVVAYEKELVGYYVADAANVVIGSKEQAKSFALTLAGVPEANAINIYAEQSWYFRGTVYDVCFRTTDMYYEYSVGADGVVIEEYYEMLHISSLDSYLTRHELENWFYQNNTDNFSRLSNLQRMRVTSEKTVDGRLIYTLSFVSDGNLYSYKIDAINKAFVSRQVSEYESAVKGDIKDKLHGMFEQDDMFHHGMPWDFDNWDLSDWNFDDDEYEWEFNYEGKQYEVEIDRWGNVKYEEKHGQNHNQLDAATLAQIRQIIADYFNCDVSAITINEVELKNEFGVRYYDVEFTYQGEEWECEIDADFRGPMQHQPPSH